MAILIKKEQGAMCKEMISRVATTDPNAATACTAVGSRPTANKEAGKAAPQEEDLQVDLERADNMVSEGGPDG
jgi:hypothetical protein